MFMLPLHRGNNANTAMLFFVTIAQIYAYVNLNLKINKKINNWKIFVVDKIFSYRYNEKKPNKL